MWNLAEVQIGIIAACGLTLRPFFTELLPTEIQSVWSLLCSLSSKESTGRGSDFIEFSSSTELNTKPNNLAPDLAQVGSYELSLKPSQKVGP